MENKYVRLKMISLKQVWQLAMYICIGVVTVLFLQSMFNEFTAGLSTFQFSRQPMSSKDNLAVAICFFKFTEGPLELGNEINITVSQFIKEDSGATEQTTVKNGTDLKVDVSISKLLLYNTAEYIRGATRHCFKIDPMTNDLTKWVTRIDLATTPNSRLSTRYGV